MSSFFSKSSCESCGRELQFNAKKTCGKCANTFCGNCLRGHDGMCYKCRVFSSSIIQRYQLEELTTSDLTSYYITRGLVLPSTVAVNDLIEGILIHQAQLITKKAVEAQNMLDDPSVLGDLNILTKTTITTSIGASPPTITTTQSTGIRKDFVPGSVTNVNHLESEDEIDLLPVKILKIILQRNCINYKGCVEKEELKERVKRLWKSRIRAKEMEDKIAGNVEAENEFLCKICMDEPVDCVLLDCGHMLSCVSCGRRLNECPVCRQFVVRVVHAFKA